MAKDVVNEYSLRRSRLRYLVLEGGLLVLKHRFDKHIKSSGISLKEWLANAEAEIKRTRFIYKQQVDILYPSSGDSSSENYDVTLLVALYRNCISKRTHDPIWQTGTKPEANDFSTEADYARLRNYRNELIHYANDERPTKEEFDTMWKDIAEVLVRLGNGLPKLNEQIEDMKKQLIDKECERKMNEQLQQLHQQENAFDKIVKEVHANNPLEIALGRSKREIQDNLGEHFVETTVFKEAQQMLEEKGLLVLEGAQGEGKTTISKRLVKDPDSCLKINTPEEWSCYSHERVRTVLIDDIFGRAVFVKGECAKWLKYLPLMSDAIKQKDLKVIITSRSYILEEVLNKMQISHLIKRNENLLTISSKDLNDDEKTKILVSHMKLTGKDVDEKLVATCVEHSNRPSSYIVGFPECAKLFCENKSLFEKEGEAFFEVPMLYIQEYLENIFKIDGVFLAFFVLWAQKPQELKLCDLEQNIDDTPKPVLRAIKQLQCRPESLSAIRKALFSHTKGFIRFNEREEVFQFDHHVVSDAVGLVVYKSNRTALLNNCDTSFIERYVRIETPEFFDKTAIGITVMLPRYGELCLRLGTLMLQGTDGENRPFDQEQQPDNQRYLDCTLLKHPAFGEQDFCEEFFKTMHKSKMIHKLLTTSVSSITAQLMAFRTIRNKKAFETEIGILAHSLKQQSLKCFASQCLREMQNLVTKHNDVKLRLQTDLSMSMLVATLNKNAIQIDFLVNQMGARADEFSLIYAASDAANREILDLLLRRSETSIRDYRGVGKKSLLIIFVEKENCAAVECILSSQYLDDEEINYKTEHDMITALHIACRSGNQDIVGQLLTTNPNLSIQDAKQKCPIHVAAFSGKIDTVKQLLKHDSRQADYPIDLTEEYLGIKLYHIAVLEGNTELIQFLKFMVPPVCVDGKNQTPLVFALQENKYTMVSQLIDVSIEHNAHTIPDHKGNTALQIAEEKMSTLESAEEERVCQDVISKLKSAVSEQPRESSNHEESA